MQTAADLSRLSDHWSPVLLNPAIAAVHDEYETLKGDDHHGASEGAQTSPVEAVLQDLQNLGQGNNDGITPEMAQTLHFLQQFVKTQIKAMRKASIPGLTPQENKNLINE